MQPPEKINGFGWLGPWLNQLRDYAASIRPLASETCNVHESASGIQILPIFGAIAGSTAASASHAFAGTVQAVPEDLGGGYEVKVALRSRLQLSADYEDTTTLTGLDTWLTVIEDDVIWLEGEFGTWPALSAVTVKSLGNGDTWGGGEIEHDGGPTVYIQTKFRLVLFRLPFVDEVPVLDPYVKTHLCLEGDIIASAKSSAGSDPQDIGCYFPFPVG